MPKKNGKTKTYSFSYETLKQIERLSKLLMLKPTNLIEFVINEKYNSCVKKNEKTEKELDYAEKNEFNEGSN